MRFKGKTADNNVQNL